MSVNDAIDGQTTGDGFDQLSKGIPDLSSTQQRPLNEPSSAFGADLVSGIVDVVGSDLLEGAVDIAGNVVGAVIGAADDLIAGIFD